MKILVIGQNGREHALAATYAKSERIEKVYIAPGNGLTNYLSKKIENVDIAMMDLEKLLAFARLQKIDLVDVAQDDIIAAGFVDAFEKENIKAFGPTKLASQLEWDKKWAREFMEKYNLPIPAYKSFSDIDEAKKYIDSLGDTLLFIKAAGLALGKGVIKAETKEQAYKAIDAMHSFGKSGETFLIEEGLIGEEFSLFAICDGKNYVVAKSAQDHKTAYDGDKGPNTGGMGSVAPTGATTSSIIRIIEQQILTPLLEGMEKEGRAYKGILYLGGMLTPSTSSGPSAVKIIEFNCRWGDPEAEVILPSIQTDYLDIVHAVLDGTIAQTAIVFDKKVRISVAACAKGYPTDYSKAKGKEIFGIESAIKLPNIILFGSGIQREDDSFFAFGGRLFYIVGVGDTIVEARTAAYDAMKLISIEDDNLHYRTDIGYRDVERLKMSSRGA